MSDKDREVEALQLLADRRALQAELQTDMEIAAAFDISGRNQQAAKARVAQHRAQLRGLERDLARLGVSIPTTLRGDLVGQKTRNFAHA